MRYALRIQPEQQLYPGSPFPTYAYGSPHGASSPYASAHASPYMSAHGSPLASASGYASPNSAITNYGSPYGALPQAYGMLYASYGAGQAPLMRAQSQQLMGTDDFFRAQSNFEDPYVIIITNYCNNNNNQSRK
jgi:hypothetical protein